MENHSCFYGCWDVAIHQCPKCKRWYCDECHEMFLPIDNHTYVETALMCAQCHYETYELPKTEVSKDA